MKTRQGFVSNSSSSSFLIEFKKDSCNECKTDWRDFINKYFYELEAGTNWDEAEMYPTYQYKIDIEKSAEWTSDKEEDKKRLEKFLSLKEENLAYFNLPYRDKLNDMLDNLEKSGHIEIIEKVRE